MFGCLFINLHCVETLAHNKMSAGVAGAAIQRRRRERQGIPRPHLKIASIDRLPTLSMSKESHG